ncbi:MAG: LuxR C-terminal-related transcriptional regulator [Christensenellaceae bacterium]|jgi:LuxR family maltose regulon positive regulatory protein
MAMIRECLPPESREYIPSAKGKWLPRSEISEKLDKGLQSSLLLVTAGTGYGKSYNVAHHVKNLDCRLIWMRLNRLDRIAPRFWDRFVHAASLEVPEIVKDIKQIGFPDTLARFDSFLRTFIRETFAGRKVVLVVDNYHSIYGSESALFFEYLAEANVDNFCLLLISEVKTDLEIIERRAADDVCVIDTQDLAFSLEETQELFKLHGADLSVSRLKHIHAHTEGWPVAIDLLATNYHQAVSDEIRAEMNASAVSRIFEHEMYGGYVSKVQDALIKASLLNEFSLGIFKELGFDIEEIYGVINKNQFIKPSGMNQMYTFQNMYREFLQEKALLIPTHEIEALYMAAGDWFMNQDMIPDAIEAYGKCGNHEKLLEAICRYPVTINRNLADFILEHLKMLPKSMIDENPIVEYLVAAVYLNNADIQKAHTLLTELEQKFSPKKDEKSRAALGEVYISLAAIALIENRVDFVEYYKKACSCLPNGSNIQKKNMMMIGACNTIMVAENKEGALQEYEALMFEAEPYIEHVMNGGGRGLANLFAADAAYYTFDLDRATEQAYQCIYKAREHEQHDIVLDAYGVLAKTAMMRGQYDVLMKQMDEINQYYEQHDLLAMHEMRDMMNGWFYAKMGDCAKVSPWIRQGRFNDFEHTPIMMGYEKLVDATCFAFEEKYDEMIALLGRMHVFFVKRGLWTFQLYTEIMMAFGYMRLGQEETSIFWLYHAYEMSYKNKVILPFIELGNQMRTLVNLARRQKKYSFNEEWLDQLYQKSSSYAKRHAVLRKEYYKNKRNEADCSVQLSRREAEVLNCLSRGFTRDEIADTLDISINTVKSTMQRLYNKLGAINRADAVRIAASMGMIRLT